MKVAVLGYGKQGQSAYAYWSKLGHSVTVCDSNPDISLPKEALRRLGPDYLKGIDEFDLLVRTPALHPNAISQANPEAPDILEKTTTVTREFLKVCPTKNVIGVTGTKGKGTTCSLITRILEASDYRVHLGGNIGTPPLDLLANNIKPNDYVVLELANFQLIDLDVSIQLAVCLMVEPEHLDWHKDISEYVNAKRQLFINQVEGDTAIYYADNRYSTSIASSSPGLLIPYMVKPGAYVNDSGDITIDGNAICSTNELKLLGEHNWQNVCAAVTAAWQTTHDVKAIKKAVVGFSGLPHRLEFIKTIGGVSYYNDSFASNPAATQAAIEALDQPKILIIGGLDRGIDLAKLARTMLTHSQTIRKAILIGASANRIEETLLVHGFHSIDNLGETTMKKIVARAKGNAHSGDVVLFSPGFPSFDMFKNFEDRGKQFRSMVKTL